MENKATPSNTEDVKAENTLQAEQALTQHATQNTEQSSNVSATYSSQTGQLMGSTSSLGSLTEIGAIRGTVGNIAQPNESSPPIVNVQALYPEALTPEQMLQKREEAKILSVTTMRTPISAIIVAAITIGVSLYITSIFISGLFNTSSSSGFGSILSYGMSSWIGWLIAFIYLLQTVAIIYAASKLWKRSLAALAFITGVSFLYFYQIVLTSFITISYLFSAKNPLIGPSVDTYAIIVISLVYFGALIDCWTRSRKHLI